MYYKFLLQKYYNYLYFIILFKKNTLLNILSVYRFSNSIQGIDFIVASTKKPLSLEEQKTINRVTIAKLQTLDPYQNQVNIHLLQSNYKI